MTLLWIVAREIVTETPCRAVLCPTLDRKEKGKLFIMEVTIDECSVPEKSTDVSCTRPPRVPVSFRSWRCLPVQERTVAPRKVPNRVCHAARLRRRKSNRVLSEKNGNVHSFACCTSTTTLTMTVSFAPSVCTIDRIVETEQFCNCYVSLYETRDFFASPTSLSFPAWKVACKLRDTISGLFLSLSVSSSRCARSNLFFSFFARKSVVSLLDTRVFARFYERCSGLKLIEKLKKHAGYLTTCPETRPIS